MSQCCPIYRFRNRKNPPSIKPINTAINTPPIVVKVCPQFGHFRALSATSFLHDGQVFIGIKSQCSKLPGTMGENTVESNWRLARLSEESIKPTRRRNDKYPFCFEEAQAPNCSAARRENHRIPRQRNPVRGDHGGPGGIARRAACFRAPAIAVKKTASWLDQDFGANPSLALAMYK